MHINWLAMAAAFNVQIIIGYTWFHPSVMGNMWAKANNTTVEAMTPKNPGMVYGLSFLYTALYTFFLYINVAGFGQEDVKFHTFQHGLAHAGLMTVLVLIPVLGTPALYEGRKKEYMIVQIGYWFLRTALAMGIISLWR